MSKENDLKFIRQAVDIALQGVSQNRGGPFGCVIEKGGIIVGRGCNEVISANDPTAHAEVVAIRNACGNLKSHQLEGCTIYTSCEPCPMCLGAIYWARPDRVVYACTRRDAAAIGFDDDFIYKEISIPDAERQISMQQCGHELGLELFRSWQQNPDRVRY